MKRGCGQSVIATASSTGSSGVSVSSQSCSTDLCNADNAVQSFNLNNFNDFLNSLSNFNAPSYSGPYPIYPTYSAFPSGLSPFLQIQIANHDIQNDHLISFSLSLSLSPSFS